MYFSISRLFILLLLLPSVSFSFNVKSEKEIKFEDHTRLIEYSPNGNYLAVDEQGTIKLFIANGNDLDLHWECSNCSPNTSYFSFSKNSKLLAYRKGSSINILEISSKKTINAISSQYHRFNEFEFSTDVLISVKSKEDGEFRKQNLLTVIQLYDTRSFYKIEEYEQEDLAIRAISVSPDGQFLAVGGFSNSGYYVVVYGISKTAIIKKQTIEIKGTHLPKSLKFSHNSDYLVMGSGNCCGNAKLQIWKYKNGKYIQYKNYFKEKSDEIISVAFTPESDYLIATGSQGIVHVWKVKDGINYHKSLKINKQSSVYYIQGNSFNPSNNTLASTYYYNLYGSIIFRKISGIKQANVVTLVDTIPNKTDEQHDKDTESQIHQGTLIPQKEYKYVYKKRIALVIGNSSYKKSPLRNPSNDANDMGELLKEFGFDVTVKIDVNQESMEEEIAKFGKRLSKGGVGLFYYSGHGVQAYGDNFLIPVGASINRQKDLKYKAVNVGQVLDEMQEAKNGFNIIILET